MNLFNKSIQELTVKDAIKLWVAYQFLTAIKGASITIYRNNNKLHLVEGN